MEIESSCVEGRLRELPLMILALEATAHNVLAKGSADIFREVSLQRKVSKSYALEDQDEGGPWKRIARELIAMGNERMQCLVLPCARA